MYVPRIIDAEKEIFISWIDFEVDKNKVSLNI